MHRLVHPQPLAIGPVQHVAALPRHLFRAHHGLEGDILGRGLHPRPVQQHAQREAIPRDHHRPRLDAAMAIDPLFQRDALQDVLQPIIAGLVHQPVNLDRPRAGGQRMGIGRRVGLFQTKLIIVVVVRDVLEGVRLLHRRIFAGHRGQARLCPPANRPRGDQGSGSRHNLTPVQIDLFRGHIRLRQTRIENLGHLSLLSCVAHSFPMNRDTVISAKSCLTNRHLALSCKVFHPTKLARAGAQSTQPRVKLRIRARNQRLTPPRTPPAQPHKRKPPPDRSDGGFL